MLSTTPSPSEFSYLSFALFLTLALGLIIVKHELCFLFYTDDSHQRTLTHSKGARDVRHVRLCI